MFNKKDRYWIIPGYEEVWAEKYLEDLEREFLNFDVSIQSPVSKPVM